MSKINRVVGWCAGVVPSPFDHSDVVTTTTHKSLRGPKGAMIFYRKGLRKVTKKGTEIMYDIGNKIDFSVFPGLQVGCSFYTQNHEVTKNSLNSSLSCVYGIVWD